MDLKGAVLRNFYSVGTLVNEATPERFFSLKVPHYQRPYKWDAARVKSLIEDWKENRDVHHETSKGYFSGAVVTVAGAGAEEHSLIDGQQRVTTLFLANYINFIIIRQLILIEVEGGRCGRLESLSHKLKLTARYVFRDKDIIKHFEDTSKFIREYSDEYKMVPFVKAKDAFVDGNPNGLDKSPIDEFYEKLWIVKPKLKYGYIDEVEVKELTVEVLSNHVKGDPLNLHYDRGSYNASLIKVLKSFYISISSGVKSEILDIERLSESELIYATALTAIVDKFTEITSELVHDDVRAFLFEMHKLITEFLEQVILCVIQTGATDDAYTLFEVMNDRALALDDLDLIKNQFFKEFIQQSSELDDDDIDQLIQSLDKQWGDDIFNHSSIRVQDKKLIPYLSTVFLTGNQSITNTRNEKYRKDLKKYLEKNKPYGEQAIHRDFNIFQVCYELINIVDLRYQKREEESLKAEFNNDSTDFQKTICFLNALKQDGVLSGLVNFVLKTLSRFSPDFDINFSREFLKLLIVKERNFESQLALSFSTQKDFDNIRKNVALAIDKIHQQSRIIWSVSMMSPKADIPRELAKKLILENNMSEPDGRQTLTVIGAEYISRLQPDFTEWLKQWNYYKDNATRFKVKTLFVRLLQFTRTQNGLKSANLRITATDSSVIELDHLVAQASKKSGVFSFENDDERELYIHGVGNMMLLPKKENIQKSDYPLEDSLEFYQNAGLSSHFLLTEIQKSVESVENKTISPSEFFSERRDSLIKDFNEIIRDYK